MDMLVPRGQLNVTISRSHPALWYVFKVADKSAESGRKKPLLSKNNLTLNIKFDLV
jgi:hypothetical protein